MRLTSVEIKNFKNVEYGKIDFTNKPSEEGASITAIYGQNGSGKTAFVDALRILNLLMVGDSIPPQTASKITSGKNYSSITYSFSCGSKLNDTEGPQASRYSIDYAIKFSKGDSLSPGSDCVLIEEALSYSDSPMDGSKGKKKHIAFKASQAGGISPAWIKNDLFSAHHVKLGLEGMNHWLKIAADLPDLDEATIARNLKNPSIRLNQGKSFIFSNEVRFSIFGDESFCNQHDPGFSIVHENLGKYAEKYISIISGRDIPAEKDSRLLLFVVTHQFDVIRTHFNEDGSESSAEVVKIPVRNPEKLELPIDGGLLSLEDAIAAKSAINQINRILGAMIPGFQIIFETASDEGDPSKVHSYLYSAREGVRSSLLHESYGIRKMIWVANVLIEAFNCPTFTAVIDEIDAGVFEYLLGELLKVVEEQGKGQLIFTSHNLMPMEKLDHRDIVFTTTNPLNRYIKPRNVKQTNNLRDMYLRSIQVGGQKEELYRSMSEAEIAFALRSAGACE